MSGNRKPLPTDDELVEMMTQSMAVSSTEGYGDYQQLAEAAFNRIRPHLEARGIEMAAEKCADAMREAEAQAKANEGDTAKRWHVVRLSFSTLTGQLRAFARRHAEGGK